MTADLLLKHGCDVMISDDLGRSALFMAIHSPLMKSLEVAKTLVASGKIFEIFKVLNSLNSPMRTILQHL